MPSKKRATPVSLQPLDALFGTNEETTNGISEIAIGSLHPFTNHPFQVRDDKKMEELAESITQYGVLVPGIVRLRESGGYELVAGHRRKRACELAGLEKMPVIIKDLTDDEATVIMVDSNIQREELLISEKAFAYKMKYMGYIDEYETSLTAMEERGYQDELGEMDIDQIQADGYEFGMDLAFGILEENENNPARVLDIQKYVNRQYDSCSRKKFMKVLETLVHAMGNDEGFIGDMYACNKKARNYYLDEMIQSFNFVFDEMCHGTGSAANCDFDVEE